MARVKLTAGRIRDFRTQEGQKQSFLWDTEAPWLAVRATGSAKVFVFQGRIDGQTVRLKIGDTAAWDIDQARAEARRLQTLIDQDIDPRDERAEKRVAAAVKRAEARRQDATVGEAWAVYLAERRAHWGERYYRDHVNLARPGGEPKKRGRGLTNPGPVAPLMALRLAELTPKRVRTWLEGEAAARATQARQAFCTLRTFLAWCEDRPEYRGLASPDAFATRLARQGLPKKGAQGDVLQREQLPAWFTAVRGLGNPVIAAYLQALLLTGARREELATLTWDNLDFRWASLTIRDKVEGERTIPLTPYVGSLLAALPRRNAWVFSSPAAQSGRLQEPRLAHNRALDTGGLPPLTLHGLRRSFGTLSEWVEMPTGVVAQIMGHKPSATAERHYRRRPLDLLRLWHTKLEGWILDEAGIEQPVEDRPAQALRRVK
jgi:integrase